MSLSLEQQQDWQRQYYADTAADYDDAHIEARDEHGFALAALSGWVGYLGIRSILDIGSGTGRGLLTLKRNNPGVRVVGIEPSEELRRIGYSKGLSQEELLDGDANHLAQMDGEFDLVCELAMLHHVPRPTWSFRRCCASRRRAFSFRTRTASARVPVGAPAEGRPRSDEAVADLRTRSGLGERGT